MKRHALSAVSPVLVALSALLAALPAAPASAAKSSPAPPISADLTIQTVAGQPLVFGDLRGKVVLLDFWATWCKPCRMAAPYLRRLQQRLGDGGYFVLVGVSSDSDVESLQSYLAAEETGWTLVWDSHGEIGKAFGVHALPTYLILDHEGRPIKALTGWSDRHPLALDSEIGRAVRRARKAAKQDG